MVSKTLLPDAPAAEAPAPDALAAALAAIVGDAHVQTGDDARVLFSQDIYARAPHLADMIVAPGSTEDLQRLVRVASAAGRALIARGAGMSYTGGYLPPTAGVVMLDMTRMNRILAIDAENMTVTLEAGCTWMALNEALAPKGLRTPFWGPLSGFASTIGGGLSQNNAFLGAAAHGPASDSVVALKVVLASGDILATGAGPGAGMAAFFRHNGPDLTGLFLGDGGALGVKAEATLRLMAAPSAQTHASFAVPTREAAAALMSALARAGIGAEIFGFDPSLQRIRLKRAGLAADLKSLAGIVAARKSIFDGVRQAARVAVAGRSFVADDQYSVHIAIEGRSAAAIEVDRAEARAIAARLGATEIENTIPKVMRAMPFTPLNNIVGPDGERWAPVHGIVPHSKAAQVWTEIEDFFASRRDAFETFGIVTGCLLTTISTNGFLIEPVFYWPSAIDALHTATLDAPTQARIPRRAPNAGADAEVDAARRRVTQIFAAHGAAHFQIGRTYLFRQTADPVALSLLDALKAAVDPDRRMNPGVLGLD